MRFSHFWSVVLFGALAFSPAFAQESSIRVTLLGTGCPPPVMDRFGPSTLVEAGGKKFLFDAGRGATQRLQQIKVKWQDVQAVFLTHLHSDHTVGFPDLWLTGWLVPPGRRVPLQVFGPLGTRNMMSHLAEAYAFDVRIRIQDESLPPEGVRIEARDIAEGVVYDDGGVRISAFEVDHAPIKPAFGYRIDYAGRSVVLSGDTRHSENLIRHAQGVDLLIHEVAAPDTFRRAGIPDTRYTPIIHHHVSPEEAGDVFARTKPRLAVYSHLVLPSATVQDVIPPTRKTYAGPLELGEDLMVIEVGDEITVRRPGA